MGLFDIFSNSDAQNAAAAQTQAIQQGYNQLSGLYNQGSQALQTNYAQALQPLQQNYNTSNAGVTQLGNLLGLNGANGSATAQNTLQNLPGYQFALGQGTQNVLRNQAATGQLNSGATNTDLTNYAQGMASQNYNNYVSELQPYLGSSNQNAAGIAGTYSNLANNLNANYTNQGNAALSAATAQGNAQAQADYANLSQSAALWGGLTGGISSLLKLPTTGGGSFGGNALSSLFSDERVKDDIEPVGELFDGQTVYRYRYKGDGRHQLGLIAQEVEDAEPSAVVQDLAGTGFKGVNYKRATNYAAEIGRMLKAA